MIFDKEISLEYSSTRLVNTCMRVGIRTYGELLLTPKNELMRKSGLGAETLDEVEELRNAAFESLHTRAERYVSNGNCAKRRYDAFVDGALSERRRILNSVPDELRETIKPFIYET